MKRVLLTSTCLVGLVMTAQAAWAQEEATGTEDGGIQDIVVTAQRREESLQKAAVAVSAVTGDDLAAAGISDTASLGRLVPSLVIAPTGGSATGFYLRGVGTLQGNAFGENPIAFNYAGVYIARPNAPVGTFYDLERVEVVKGPQGTLYGRNATGGAINVLPKRPTLGAFGGDLTAEYGNYEAKKISGALNLPIGDSVALRVAGQIVDRNGYLSDGYSDDVGEAVRVSLMFKPAGDWSALLTADYYHQGGKGVGGVLAPGAAFGNPSGFTYPGYTAPALGDRIGGSDPRSIAALAASPPPAGAFLGNGFVAPPKGDGFNDSTFYGISAAIEGDLGFGTLSIIPAYRRSEPNFRFYTFGFLGDVKETDDQTSLEVRLASNGDSALKYVLGAYYFIEDQKAANRFLQGRLSDTLFQPDLETTSKAVFAQFTYNVANSVRLVAGGRYTDETKRADTAVQLFGPAGQTANTSSSSRQNASKFTWKAGVEADLGAQSLLYANVATGFKAGGFFVGSVDNSFDPETLTAFTVGSKNRFLDNKLQFNVEAFYWKYKDQQISFVGPVQIVPGVFAAGGKTVNAGKANFYGVEADLQFAITPQTLFSANLLYNHTKYDSLNYVAISAGGGPLRNGCAVTPDSSKPVAPPARLFSVNCAGQQGLNAPELSGSVSLEQTMKLSDTLDLVLNGRSRFSSSYYVSLEYLPEEKQSGYLQADAAITLKNRNDSWSLTGFVNNITNKTIIASAFARPVLQTVYAVVAPPRTYGVRVGFKF
jgi:iron complex outermembrane receptor protein